MKAIILAGGLGTRISEESVSKPKPMIEIGSMPILWHIVKFYSCYGINDFIICCGYKGYVIKEYFSHYSMHMTDITLKINENSISFQKSNLEPWTVALVDTGQNSMTGGRLKRIRSYIKNDEPICFTYGDGVADVNISELIAFHNKHGKKVTLTATHPPGRYGVIKFKKNKTDVSEFVEKPEGDGSWINSGFFVLDPSVIDQIEGDHSSWEKDSLVDLARAGQVSAYKHNGFWQPMDTLREKILLNELWDSGKAPWKVWK